jgi:uncharacterized Zn finger protein
MGDNVKKLPGNVSHLQRLIGSHATDRRMPPARLQRWLNAMIVTAVLDRVRDEDGEPIFLLKGDRRRDELVERLRTRRAPAARGAKAAAPSANASDGLASGAPLSTVLDSFWFCGSELEAFHVNPLAGEAPGALLRQLGPAPVEVADRNLGELLVDTCAKLAHAAERTALGDPAEG